MHKHIISLFHNDEGLKHNLRSVPPGYIDSIAKHLEYPNLRAERTIADMQPGHLGSHFRCQRNGAVVWLGAFLIRSILRAGDNTSELRQYFFSKALLNITVFFLMSRPIYSAA